MNNIPYITCGYPTLEATKKEILNHQEVKRIVLSIPFSDPVTEEVNLQEACIVALKNGIKVKDIFSAISQVNNKTSLTIKTYANVIYNFGIDQFLSNLQSLNITSIIIPDIPYEEREEFLPHCEKYGIHLVPIVSTKSKQRIEMIVKDSPDFIYLTSMKNEDTHSTIQEIKKYTDKAIISDQDFDYIL